MGAAANTQCHVFRSVVQKSVTIKTAVVERISVQDNGSLVIFQIALINADVYPPIEERFYNSVMYRQLKERLMERVSEEEAEEVCRNAFTPYFELFMDEPKDRAGFGLGVGRLAQFLLGKTSIVEM